ncbi:hypothetical protein CENA302_07445 [Cylindrospermopsis raciborskii CENA302]|uniref:Uncharacterized protein n=1 Tax=Cylindrospermopsis raciborskii CENA302 TaxID=1170768 RepID=A0A9Q5QXM1_9CYAN|nr:hypothetical protein CENA302_07445 [Cylindrospermopsis raciborskii CENA302]
MKSTTHSPDFLEKPMTTSRQPKQPQSTLAFECYLLHDDSKESSPHIHLVGRKPKDVEIFSMR